jgi:hypothetical protein
MLSVKLISVVHQTDLLGPYELGMTKRLYLTLTNLDDWLEIEAIQGRVWERI